MVKRNTEQDEMLLRERDNIVADFNRGVSYKKIAKTLKCHTRKIRPILEAAGCIIRVQPHKKEINLDKETAYRLYITEGKSTSEIGDMYGVTHTIINTRLGSMGIPLRALDEAKIELLKNPETRRNLISGIKKSQESGDYYKARPQGKWNNVKMVEAKPCLMGENCPNKDVVRMIPHWELEVRKFCSYSCNSRYHNTGENNPAYVHGESTRNYPFEFYSIRKRIIERDNSTCQICGEKTDKIDIHHIEYDKQKNKEEDLISLCKPCHAGTNPADVRDFYIKLFKTTSSTEERAFLYHRCQNGFPYPDYSDDKVIEDFVKLKDWDNYEGINENKVCGNFVLNKFIKSKWQARRKEGISYFDAFHDDMLLERTIKKALSEGSASETRIRNNISTNYTATKVHSFSNFYCKYLYSRYLKPQSIIFDPCAGWGNRMISALAMGEEHIYYGQDVNETLVTELSKVIRFLNSSENLKIACADSTQSVPPIYADMIFTCPPYYDMEIYEDSKEFIYTSYYDWLNNFLFRIIDNSLSILKRDSHFCICIKNTKEYNILDDAKEYLDEKQLSFMEAIEITHQQGYMKKNSDAAKLDTILVYKTIK